VLSPAFVATSAGSKHREVNKFAVLTKSYLDFEGEMDKNWVRANPG